MAFRDHLPEWLGELAVVAAFAATLSVSTAAGAAMKGAGQALACDALADQLRPPGIVLQVTSEDLARHAALGAVKGAVSSRIPASSLRAAALRGGVIPAGFAAIQHCLPNAVGDGSEEAEFGWAETLEALGLSLTKEATKTLTRRATRAVSERGDRRREYGGSGRELAVGREERRAIDPQTQRPR